MGNPKLFILSEQMRGTSFALTADEYTIGRAEDCDLCIPDPTVSGHHCILSKQEDGESYNLVDTGSTNGTRVNDHKVEEGEIIPLKHGDILLVGSIEILFDDKKRGEENGQRTVSVINLDETGTSEINKTAMTNLATKFMRKTAPLRPNQKHNTAFTIGLSILAVLAVALLAWMFLK